MFPVPFFTLTPAPFDGLTALSRFDKLTTLSWPKGLSKGSPLKGEGTYTVNIPQGRGRLWKGFARGAMTGSMSGA